MVSDVPLLHCVPLHPYGVAVVIVLIILIYVLFCIICVFPCHQLLDLLLSKGGHGIGNVCIVLSVS